MRNRYVTTLVTLGVVGVFLLGMAPAAEAELICKRFRPSGPKVCWEASTGSVDCLTVAQGVSAKLLKDCDGTTGDDDCHITITCSIFGTIPPWGNKHDPDYEYCSALPTEEGLACGIAGQAECLNPQDFFNANGQAYTWPGPLSSGISQTFTCEKGGVCTEIATVAPPLGEGNGGVCNNLWTLIDFTPYEFFGGLTFCPYYVDGISGECCYNDKVTNGKCDTPFQRNQGEEFEGQPGYIWTFCELPSKCTDEDDPDYDPGFCFDENGIIKAGVKYACDEI